ncbi:MAG: hypothetical protein WBO09_18725 [Methylocystis silviterrae]|uniref:hypothetical protein n=1 Tax=Methylocystis silviterrae TaxID=2743612 RepID=UPI003BC1A1C6
MAMGRESEVQGDLMVTWKEMPRSPGHVFYDRLQHLLADAGFDAFVVSFVMAWSPIQRSNAGIIWVQQPGDYANQFPTTSATGPIAQSRNQSSVVTCFEFILGGFERERQK